MRKLYKCDKLHVTLINTLEFSRMTKKDLPGKANYQIERPKICAFNAPTAHLPVITGLYLQ